MGQKEATPDLLPGTLDLLILRALAQGTMHGYSIAARLREVSGDVLQAGESSLTAAPEKQLARERNEFERIVGAIFKVPESA